jgi:hypothetical protein
MLLQALLIIRLFLWKNACTENLPAPETAPGAWRVCRGRRRALKETNIDALRTVGSCKCFAMEGQVKTPSGYRNIEDIRAGDKVLSYNERTKRLEVQTVAQTFIRKTDRIYTLVYTTGTKLQTTATYPFYMEGKGWVKAADLHIDVYGGARLQSVSYRQSKQGVIVSITVEERAETVYNFEVNETHTYLVGESDVVVHNAQGYEAEQTSEALKEAGSYEKSGIIDSIGQCFKNWWNSDGLFNGFETDKQVIDGEKKKHGLIAGYEKISDLGYALDDKGTNAMSTYNGFERTKEEILAGCSCRNPHTGVVDESQMSESDRLKYEAAVDGQINMEYEHSQALYKTWKDDGLSDVPLTPYAKQIIQHYLLPGVTMERLDSITISTPSAEYQQTQRENSNATYVPESNTVYSFIRSGQQPENLCQICVQDLAVLTHELTHMEQADQLGSSEFRSRHGKENDPRTIKDFPNAPATPNYGPSNTGESDTLEGFACHNQKYAQKLLFQKHLSPSLRLKQ